MKSLFTSVICLVVVSWLIPGSTVAKDYTGKKILYIDSYHVGYPWSDGILQGVQGVLAGKGLQLKVIHMDTKRNKSEEFNQQAGLKAKAVIEEFQPDVVIASDDNAAKYLIAPYYKDAKSRKKRCPIHSWVISSFLRNKVHGRLRRL